MVWAKPYLFGPGLPVGHQLAPSSRRLRMGRPGGRCPLGAGCSEGPLPLVQLPCSVNGTLRQLQRGEPGRKGQAAGVSERNHEKLSVRGSY